MSKFNSNDALVNSLKQRGLITDRRVEDAFRCVDWGNFIPSNQGPPYEDRPYPIGWNATISAPHIHAINLSILAHHLRPGSSALDVGSGSAFFSCLMAHLVGPTGRVLAVEHVSELVTQSRRNVERLAVSPQGAIISNMWRDGRFNILVRDARAENFVGGGFDAIHVGAAVDSLRSAEHLAAMLRPGGRMVVPVGKESQALMVVDKGMNGRTHEWKAGDVTTVPITSVEHQKGKR